MIIMDDQRPYKSKETYPLLLSVIIVIAVMLLFICFRFLSYFIRFYFIRFVSILVLLMILLSSIHSILIDLIRSKLKLGYFIEGGKGYIFALFIYSIILFFAIMFFSTWFEILLHESGHAFAAFMFGAENIEIDLTRSIIPFPEYARYTTTFELDNNVVRIIIAIAGDGTTIIWFSLIVYYLYLNEKIDIIFFILIFVVLALQIIGSVYSWLFGFLNWIGPSVDLNDPRDASFLRNSWSNFNTQLACWVTLWVLILFLLWLMFIFLKKMIEYYKRTKSLVKKIWITNPTCSFSYQLGLE